MVLGFLVYGLYCCEIMTTVKKNGFVYVDEFLNWWTLIP